MAYTEFHRFFLRNIMHFGVLSEAEAKDLISTRGGGENLKDFIPEINRKIRPMMQEIKLVFNEMNGSPEVVFISYAEDEASRAQNLFSTAETEYFKFLLEDIIMSETKNISGIAAINATSKVNVGQLSKTRAQELLDIWTAKRYFRKGTNGYGLDTRGIHEFDNYIRNNFTGVIESCNVCKKGIFLKPIECPHCEELSHIICVERYITKISKWPCCKKECDRSRFNSMALTQQQPSTSTQNLSQTPSEVETWTQSFFNEDEALSPISQPSQKRRGTKRPR